MRQARTWVGQSLRWRKGSMAVVIYQSLRDGVRKLDGHGSICMGSSFACIKGVKFQGEVAAVWFAGAA